MKYATLFICLASFCLSQEQPLHLVREGEVVKFGTDSFSVWMRRQDGKLIALRSNGRTALQEAPQEADRLWLSLKQADGAWLKPENGNWSVETWSQTAFDTVRATLRLGNWKIDVYTRLLTEKRQLCRWFDIAWKGEKETKLRGLSQTWGVPTLPEDSYYLCPGSVSPRPYTRERILNEGQSYTGYAARELIFNLENGGSLVFLSNELADGAEHGNRVGRHVDGKVVVTDTANIQARMRTDVTQHLGEFWLWVQDNDAEAALVRTHEWFRDRKAVPPIDRPDWVQRATLYSFHPGGSIGSGWRDWGGFAKAKPQISRMAELGCNTLWILPVEDLAPYHPRDYYKFAAGLGTPEEYRTLVKTAKNLGLHVWQDCVPHGGSNTYPRAKEHPEWLVQQEDGSTLGYWCFDFRWPSWCEYMKNVAAYYVKNYGVDGFRIDACGGSKIANWNPNIPYPRASTALLQGGLAMQTAIRQGVRENTADGATLAEDGSNYAGTVSDCIYDFTFCYQMMQRFRTLPPGDFVKDLSRWLHEQRYSHIPGQVFMRHVESHDSLRAEYWYGPGGMEAAMAISAWCHGIPMVYMDMEDGHAPVFRRIFSLRNNNREITDGEQDTLSVKAPDGVFTVLRTLGGRAAIGLVNCNPFVVNGAVSLSLDKLPEELRNVDVVRDLWTDASLKATRRDGSLSFSVELQPFGPGFISFTPQAAAATATASFFDNATALLPIQTVKYDTTGKTSDSSQDGGGLLIRVPLEKGEPCEWRVEAANGVWHDTFRTRHPDYVGARRKIYHLPQGGNVLWDSRLWPFGVTDDKARISFATPRGAVTLQFDSQRLPAGVFLLDRVGDVHEPHVFVAPMLPDYATAPENCGMAVSIVPYRQVKAWDGAVTDSLSAYAGKWKFDNGKIQLWIRRSGTVESYSVYRPDGSLKAIFSDADLYTDAGYWTDPDYKKHSAGQEAEPLSRINVLPDGTLRLRFSGHLRGSQRFATLAQPIDYMIEYRLNDENGFGYVFGIRPQGASHGERVFAAQIYALPETFAKVDMVSRGKAVLSGNSSKVREAQTAVANLSSAVDEMRLFDKDGNLHCRWSGIVCHGEAPENMFVHNRNAFFAFSDHKETPASMGKWRLVSTYISTDLADHDSPEIPAVQDMDMESGELLLDGGFEASDASQWIDKIVQNIEKKSFWNLSAGARYVSDVVHSGKSALCVDGASGEYRLSRQPLDIRRFKPGTTWRVSCWIKAQDFKPDSISWMVPVIRVTEYITGQKDVVYASLSFPMGTYDWRQFSYVFTVPENIEKMMLAVGFNGDTGTMWVDDITIEPIVDK